jgi:hypothetical protein
MPKHCIVKANQHGKLYFKLFWNGMRSTEGTRCLDTPENRELVEAKALIIRREIEDKCFDYLKHFPNGNKAHLFRIEPDRPLVLLTFKLKPTMEDG